MFKIANMRPMAQTPREYYITTDDEAIVLGEALVLSSGALTKCGATATPEFIAMAAAADEATIPVIRVTEETVFEVPMYGDGSSLVVGDSVTLHTTGVQVTATTASGVFYLTAILESGATGTPVQGMFRR